MIIYTINRVFIFITSKHIKRPGYIKLYSGLFISPEGF